MSRSQSTSETPIEEATFCAVDVETSGLRMTSRVIEIGAVRFDLSGTHSEFQTLVNPCERISWGATGIHGITDEMVSLAPRALDVLPGLLNFMRGSVFVAHNARFDVKMLGDELSRARVEPPSCPVLCTVLMARNRIAGPANYRLGTLVDHLGIDARSLHNALPDALAARDVFLEATRGLPGATTVGELPGHLGLFDGVAPSSLEDIEPCGDPDELEALARSRIAIEMEYRGGSSGGPVVVTPQYLFAGNGHRYMKAYCHRDGIQKSYRLDRISSFRRA